LTNATEKESRHWSLGDTVSLRGLDQPTQLAVPV
jgi:adenylate cyclase